MVYLAKMSFETQVPRWTNTHQIGLTTGPATIRRVHALHLHQPGYRPDDFYGTVGLNE